jgi:hypothetical protein
MDNWQSACLENRSPQGYEGSSPSPSAASTLVSERTTHQKVPLAEQSGSAFHTRITQVQILQGTLGDRLMVGRQSLKLFVKVRLLLPEPCGHASVRKMSRWCTGRTCGRNPQSDGSTPSLFTGKHVPVDQRLDHPPVERKATGSNPVRDALMHRLGIGEPKRL